MSLSVEKRTPSVETHFPRSEKLPTNRETTPQWWKIISSMGYSN
ncbi:hypothetical protein [Alteribacillus sp. HJP-4]